ncbi:unnamed protein product [Coccothraustes coccothraustes]
MPVTYSASLIDKGVQEGRKRLAAQRLGSGGKGWECNVPSCSGASSEHRGDTTSTPRPLGTDLQVDPFPAVPPPRWSAPRRPGADPGRGQRRPGGRSRRSRRSPLFTPRAHGRLGLGAPSDGAAASGPAPVRRRGSEPPRFSGNTRPRGRPRFAELASAWLAGKTKRKQGKENGEKVVRQIQHTWVRGLLPAIDMPE